MHDEAEPFQRIERVQHDRRGHDVRDARHADHDEPEHHHRPEHGADAARAMFLRDEQDDERGKRHRNHIGLERGLDDFEPFHGAQHGNGRRDHAIAKEQRRAHHTHHEEPSTQTRARRDRRRREREQRHDAAFAVIIRPQDQDDVLQRNDDHQRPEDQRNDADDIESIERETVGGIEHGGERIERARADVTIDHAERGQRERWKSRRRFAVAFLPRPGGRGMCHVFLLIRIAREP
jgi:hypothetical protein